MALLNYSIFAMQNMFWTIDLSTQLFCQLADPHLLRAMPSSKKTIGAPHLMLPVMVASSMMQVMWSSTPATNSDKKTKKKEKKKQEKKPSLVHVQALSYVSDQPPSLAQQVDQKLQSIENQFAIASGYSLTSFPSTSTFRRHWVCKSREYSAVVFKIHKSFSNVFVNHCKHM